MGTINIEKCYFESTNMITAKKVIEIDVEAWYGKFKINWLD
jgi:hypothetical protein